MSTTYVTVCSQCHGWMPVKRGTWYKHAHRKSPFCSVKCKGESQIRGTNYRNIYLVGSARGGKSSRGRAEHRIVMEAFLGRSLLKSELVHHINGNRRDNRLENLAVMSLSEHQRLHLTPERARAMRAKVLHPGPERGWRARLSQQLPNL